MRVLMVAACPLPWRRGTPIRVSRMADALCRIGHQVDVVTYPLGDPAIDTEYRIHRVAKAARGMNPEPGPSLFKLAYLDPLVTLKISQLLGEQRFDVVHAHHYESLIAALLTRRLGRRLPVVYDSHTLLATELPAYRLGLPKRLSAWTGLKIDRALPRRADHVIAVTERMRSWFIDQASISADRVSLIPNGVEYDHFTLAEAKKTEPSDEPTIVFAGNLAAYQRVDLLLLAFQQVVRLVPRARLVILSDSRPDAVRAQASALGLSHRVSFENPEFAVLPVRLAQADILANPRTDCDGIPQKLLNYMAVGRPIVSFVGSASVLENERNALIVPDGDVAAFAGAVVRLLNTPELGSRLGSAARARAESLTWQDVAHRVETVYRRVVGPGAKPESSSE